MYLHSCLFIHRQSGICLLERIEQAQARRRGFGGRRRWRHHGDRRRRPPAVEAGGDPLAGGPRPADHRLDVLLREADLRRGDRGAGVGAEVEAAAEAAGVGAAGEREGDGLRGAGEAEGDQEGVQGEDGGAEGDDKGEQGGEEEEEGGEGEEEEGEHTEDGDEAPEDHQPQDAEEARQVEAEEVAQGRPRRAGQEVKLPVFFISV